MPRSVLAPAKLLPIVARSFAQRPAPGPAERVLTRREVETLIRVSRQAFDRLRHREDFPRPRRWLRASPRWLESELVSWIEGAPPADQRAVWSWPVAHPERRDRGAAVRTWFDMSTALHERARACAHPLRETVNAFVREAVRQRVERLERTHAAKRERGAAAEAEAL